MVVTSPPYDNLRTYNGMPAFTFDVFKPIADQLARVIKPGGVIVWNVADATVNGSETGSSFRQALYFKDSCGLNLHDTMIWQKTDYPPQTKVGMRYTNSFEYMFVFSKGRPTVFNAIHAPTMNPGVKKETTTQRDANGVSRLTRRAARKGRVIKDTKPLSSVWTFAKQGAGASHPAQFPLKLPSDHIISWSNPGDLILDPFGGSGTTAIAAENAGRRWMCIERDETYYNAAVARIWDHVAAREVA